MGTTYDIKVVTNLFKSRSVLQDRIARRLVEINNSVSTYNSKSEISQFNSSKDLEVKFHPSHDFLCLLMVSRELYNLVGDVWDPTIDPVVNAWGFGRDVSKNCVLESDEISLLLRKVGFEKAIIFCSDNSIKKGFAEASIDLASIAKGFGVDQLALLLYNDGFNDFLIEIGGEVYARGCRIDGQPWCVGINLPSITAAANEVYKTLLLSNKAIATSGNYRNFMQIDGEFFSHIIDPRTGCPVSNCVNSVSIIAENCTIADGLATALMMYKPTDAVDLINGLPFVECIITTSETDVLKSYISNGIEALQ